MQRKLGVLVFLVHLMLSSCAHSNDFVLYQKDQAKPSLYGEKGTEQVTTEFISFSKKIGVDLSLSNSLSNSNDNAIKLLIDAKIIGFSLVLDKKHLIISGSSTTNLRKGIRYFFTNYTQLNQFNYSKSIGQQQRIVLPNDLNFQSNKTFEFIEPYFAENFSEEFRLWNNTNTIEESWGLWGHNIGKFIQVVPSMYAIVDGKPNAEQLNFASADLERALEVAVNQQLNSNPQANRFMIMPYDNDLVCQCASCVALGNTKTNASPAVFTLINRLAKKFPKAQFFSTAYVSTDQPPKGVLQSNVGVMISTMSFPKGVVLEDHKKSAEIVEKIKSWKLTTGQVYLWDYAINFDNFFEFYPTVAIVQKNLKFFAQNGVNGVFIHGSDEGSFAAFGDLKCYLYAQLLNDLSVDLNAKTKLFFENRYPTYGNVLWEYFNSIETDALNSKKPIDIYGGIKQAEKKYLNQDSLSICLNKLIRNRGKLKASEQAVSERMLMAFLFQHLEILRTHGVAENGYASLVGSSVILHKSVRNEVELLKSLALSQGIDSYNESKASLKDYISMWYSRLINQKYQNLFYQKPFKVMSELDEDYVDTNMLNDGALGFKDYYNNWLINSSPSLAITASLAGMKGAKMVLLSFLNDPKHRIYAPEKVYVTVGEREYVGNLTLGEDGGVEIKDVRIPIEVRDGDSTIKIEIKKRQHNGKSLLACDEIIIR